MFITLNLWPIYLMIPFICTWYLIIYNYVIQVFELFSGQYIRLNLSFNLCLELRYRVILQSLSTVLTFNLSTSVYDIVSWTSFIMSIQSSNACSFLGKDVMFITADKNLENWLFFSSLCLFCLLFDMQEMF